MVKFTGNAGDFLKIGVAAAARGDVDQVREILKSKPKWIKHVGSHGRTMLWEASHRGKLEMVKYLVRRKADIDAFGTHYTPYFVDISCYCIARHKNHHDVADFLQAKGAKFDIFTAAFLGECHQVKKFLKRKPSLVNMGHPQYGMVKKNPAGIEFAPFPAPWATPLCYALRGGDVETVKFLIKKQSIIKGNEESLLIAAGDNSQMVGLLLENGAELAPQVFSDKGEMFQVVSRFGVTPDKAACSEELVYLCRGDRGGNPDTAKRLLRIGADVNHQDAKGKTALHRAAKAGFVETMQILLDHGALVDLVDLQGETPLFDAVRSTIKNIAKKKKAIRLLLKSGADRKHANRKDETPLSLTKKSKPEESKDLVRILQSRD